jgi:hypothetical protein
MQARTLVLVILLVQGVYDLSLGGWLWLARQSLASARAPDSLHRLHALVLPLHAVRTWKIAAAFQESSWQTSPQ